MRTRLGVDELGQASIEYALIVSCIVVVTVAALAPLASMVAPEVEAATDIVRGFIS